MNTLYTKTHVVILALIVSISCIPAIPVVQAETYSPSGTIEYTLLEPLPCVGANSDCKKGPTVKSVKFDEYVQYAFNLAIALAAFAAVFMIVWGGLQYMSSDAWSGKSAGLDKLKKAVLGLLLVLCSYLILKTIDPRLVAIPTTLVPPLKITYTPELNSFLAGIDSEVKSIKTENVKLTQEVQAAREKLADLDKQEQAVLAAQGDNPDQIKYACENDPNVASEPTCVELARIQNQRVTAQTDVAYKVGQASMNDTILSCQAQNGGTNFAYCRSQLLKTRETEAAKLTALGKTVEAKQLTDYGSYASALLDINNSVTQNMSKSPYVAALKSTVESGLYIGGALYAGAAGSIGAGVVGGVIINGLSSQNDQKSAALTVTDIKSTVDRVLPTITDPTTRANLITQEKNLIHSLGGTAPKRN